MTKNTISVDWFECLVSGWAIPTNGDQQHYWFANNRICFYRRKKIVPHFLDYFDISIDNKPFGYALMNPRNKEIFGSDVIQIKVNNNRLYEAEWMNTFQFLLKSFTWKMQNVSRLDIALDGHGFMAVGQKLLLGKIRKIGKAQFFPRLNSKMQVQGFRLGSMSSSKSLVCYDKTAELEVSNKYYIRDMWKKAGLDTTQNVERLELRLRNEAIKMIEDFDYTKLDNFEYLASLMRTNFYKFYQFYSPKKDTNVSRYNTFDYIDWDSVGGVYLPKLSTKMADDVYRLKQSSKTDFFKYLQTGESLYLNLAKESALNANCVEWFIDRVDKWKDEFAYKLGRNGTGEIYYPYLSCFKMVEKGDQLPLFDFEMHGDYAIFNSIK